MGLSMLVVLQGTLYELQAVEWDDVEVKCLKRERHIETREGEEAKN